MVGILFQAAFATAAAFPLHPFLELKACSSIVKSVVNPSSVGGASAADGGLAMVTVELQNGKVKENTGISN